MANQLKTGWQSARHAYTTARKYGKIIQKQTKDLVDDEQNSLYVQVFKSN